MCCWVLSSEPERGRPGRGCRRKTHRSEHRSAVPARGGRVVPCLARACRRQKNRGLHRIAPRRIRFHATCASYQGALSFLSADRPALTATGFTGVKLEYPWGRHFLPVCLQGFVKLCKREKF